MAMSVRMGTQGVYDVITNEMWRGKCANEKCEDENCASGVLMYCLVLLL